MIAGSSKCSIKFLFIPHPKFKSRLATIQRNSSINKNGNRRHRYLVLSCEEPYFGKEHSDLKSKNTEEDITVFKGFIIDCRHSIGHELRPSPSRHISVLRTTNRNPYSLWSRPVRNSISVQPHIKIHCRRIVQ